MTIRGTMGDRAGLAPLKSALEAYAMRHRVVSGNIANAETPGYRPKRVEFEDIAKRVLGDVPSVSPTTTDPRHISSDRGDARSIPNVTREVSANDPEESLEVDVEKELVSMVQNQLSYRLAVRLLDMKYRQLHSAIAGESR